jgi:two-component system, OmpR family, sensor histidine kinase KdpD
MNRLARGAGRSRRWVKQWTRRPGVDYALAVLFVALVTLGVALVPTGVSTTPTTHRSPVYVLAVLAAGALLGRGPAVLAAVLSFLAFDWFFVQPLHTFAVEDPEEWQALLLFLAAALVTGTLTAALRDRAELANQREREALALYEVGKTLSAARPVDAAARATAQQLRVTLDLALCDVVLAEESGLRSLEGQALSTEDLAVAQWVLAQRQPASRRWARESRRLVRVRPPRGSAVMAPPGEGSLFLPLVVEERAVGVLRAVARGGVQQGAFSAADMRLLMAAADQLAVAFERSRLQQEQLRGEVLRRTDELRSVLLSAVSHDFRTPLASIKAAAGTLGLPEPLLGDEGRRAAAAQIEREADRLNRLVENLLDLSRIEAGALRLDRQWYPLRELVEDTVGRMGAALQQHTVVVDVPDDLPPVPLDYILVQQVLSNLLDNAARYSPPGTAIRVGARPVPSRLPEAIEVRVEDEGPGVPPQDRERIFRRFFRLARDGGDGGDGGIGTGTGGPPGRDGSGGHVSAGGGGGQRLEPRSDRARQGLGYGLAVCAGFVAAHGGRLWVEDSSTADADDAGRGAGAATGRRPGTLPGAAFIFTLPLSERVA